MNRLLSAYATLPRAGRWAVAGCLVVLGYFVIVEPLVDRWGKLRAKAEQRELALTSFIREQQAMEAARAAVAMGLHQYGEVSPPGDQESRVDAFNRRLSEVFSTHGVPNQRIVTRTASLPKGPLLDYLGAGSAVTRLTYDISFDATPEQISAIVADLERSPEVAAVSRVHMRRIDELERQRQLRASLWAEVWLLSRKGGSS